MGAKQHLCRCLETGYSFDRILPWTESLVTRTHAVSNGVVLLNGIMAVFILLNQDSLAIATLKTVSCVNAAPRGFR
jgi:hypothetical protein